MILIIVTTILIRFIAISITKIALFQISHTVPSLTSVELIRSEIETELSVLVVSSLEVASDELLSSSLDDDASELSVISSAAEEASVDASIVEELEALLGSSFAVFAQPIIVDAASKQHKDIAIFFFNFSFVKYFFI